MEIFVFLFIGWVIYNVYSGYKQREAEEAVKELLESIEKERRENKFTCRVVNDKIEGEEFTWDVFKVQMKGLVDGKSDNFSVKYHVRMSDITDGEAIILSTIEEFQANDSTIFAYESSVDTLPYENTIFNDWVQTANIPKMFLEFPRSGKRKIEFKVFVVDPKTDNILAEASTIVQYVNPDKGYKEKNEEREYFEEMVIKTAMLVSASDNNMDEEEAQVIKSWIEKKIKFYKEEYQEEEKQRLNGYTREAYYDINNNLIDIYDSLEGIENIASDGDKFELFQVCLDVAQADGEADEAELEIIHDIADYIDLDEKQFKSMIEKTLPITMHTSPSNDENILGIFPDMTEKEIKRILREHYQKWNARVASTDPKIREQAEEMIQLIAEARKKYIS